MFELIAASSNASGGIDPIIFWLVVIAVFVVGFKMRARKKAEHAEVDKRLQELRSSDSSSGARGSFSNPFTGTDEVGSPSDERFKRQRPSGDNPFT